MQNSSLVTLANHSREKIEYLIHMAREFEQNPNRRLLEGKVVATLSSSRVRVHASALKLLPIAWEPV